MTTTPAPPFKFLAGDPSLDFVNTVDWTARGLANERIPDFEALTRWAEKAGTLDRREGRRFRKLSKARPREARSAHETAVALRATLKRLFDGVAAKAALEEFNRHLGGALESLRLRPSGDGRGCAWRFAGSDENLASIVFPVAWAAARLLVSDEARSIRVCAGADCGWLYVDRSRNGLRRWCAMETCGTIEKSRRRRERVVRARTTKKRKRDATT